MPGMLITREMMTRECIDCGALSPGRFPSGLGGKQHLKLAGPGQSPARTEPEEHVEAHLQSPPVVPQLALVQHLMSVGVPGQAPEIKSPPPAVHAAVAIQTPGRPPAPVQGSLTPRCRTFWSSPEALPAGTRDKRAKTVEYFIFLDRYIV